MSFIDIQQHQQQRPQTMQRFKTWLIWMIPAQHNMDATQDEHLQNQKKKSPNHLSFQWIILNQFPLYFDFDRRLHIFSINQFMHHACWWRFCCCYSRMNISLTCFGVFSFYFARRSFKSIKSIVLIVCVNGNRMIWSYKIYMKYKRTK